MENELKSVRVSHGESVTEGGAVAVGIDGKVEMQGGGSG